MPIVSVEFIPLLVKSSSYLSWSRLKKGEYTQSFPLQPEGYATLDENVEIQID